MLRQKHNSQRRNRLNPLSRFALEIDVGNVKNFF